jgi:hypothetical protein
MGWHPDCCDVSDKEVETTMSTIRLSMLASYLIALGHMIGAPHTALAGDRCVYQNEIYSDGALSCQAGVRFECDDGDWKSKKEPCSPGRITQKRETIEAPGQIIERKSEVEQRD